MLGRGGTQEGGLVTTPAPRLRSVGRPAAVVAGALTGPGKRTGEYDEQWPVWYAQYMLAEQTGEELPT
jgi:hypothetical protein